MKKIGLIFIARLSLVSCQKEKLNEGKKIIELEPPKDQQAESELDRYLFNKFTTPYNVKIVYRYDESAFSRNKLQYVTPMSEKKALEIANLIHYMYYEPYSLNAPKNFMQNYTPKMLVFVGSNAYKPGAGTALRGLSTGGVKIEMLGLNYVDPNSTNPQVIKEDIDESILRLLYHESSHILEQTKLFDPEYQKYSVSDYKGGLWNKVWRGNDYLKSGFISAYSSDNFHEDFVELLARYIIYYQKDQCGCETTDATKDTDGDGLDDTAYSKWKTEIEAKGYIWEEELATAAKGSPTGNNLTGKDVLLKKLDIVRKYLKNEWKIDLDALRREIHRRHDLLQTKDFSKYEK